MPEMIRIAIVDDHPIFIGGLRRVLTISHEFAVVAEGASAEDAIRIARDDAPDVMLLDISMPGDGIAAAKEIAVVAPGVRVIMLTASLASDHVLAAMGHGAAGYIPKGEGAAELRHAIKSVHKGQTYVNQALAAQVLRGKSEPESQLPSVESRSLLSKIVGRDRVVLELAARGMRNKEIAAELQLSVPTIKCHMSRILAKLHVRSRIDAIKLVVEK